MLRKRPVLCSISSISIEGGNIVSKHTFDFSLRREISNYVTNLRFWIGAQNLSELSRRSYFWVLLSSFLSKQGHAKKFVENAYAAIYEQLTTPCEESSRWGCLSACSNFLLCVFLSCSTLC